MKKTTTIFAVALTSAITLSTLANTAAANTAAPKAAEKTQQQSTTQYVIDTIDIAGEAKTILTDARAARMAIFDGQDAAALDLVKKALSSFDKDVAKYALKLQNGAGFAVPIDNSISFIKGYKPTADQTAVITAAGKLAKSGKPMAAFKKMLDGNIALDFKYAMLPVSNTVSQLEIAYADLQAKKFYEANLALKAIETSVIVEGFAASASPQQGYEWETIIK
jgi:hypothetical protein